VFGRNSNSKSRNVLSPLIVQKCSHGKYKLGVVNHLRILFPARAPSVREELSFKGPQCAAALNSSEITDVISNLRGCPVLGRRIDF